jgi:hypothetical protein
MQDQPDAGMKPGLFQFPPPGHNPILVHEPDAGEIEIRAGEKLLAVVLEALAQEPLAQRSLLDHQAFRESLATARMGEPTQAQQFGRHFLRDGFGGALGWAIHRPASR